LPPPTSKETLDPYLGEIADEIAKVLEQIILHTLAGPKHRKIAKRILSSHGQSKKSLARVVAYYNALHLPHNGGGQPLSASQIREKLPAMLQDIDTGDLANALKTPVRFKTLSHLKQKKPELKDDYSDRGGRPSFYRDSTKLVQVVKKFLERPQVQERIDSYLLQSGLLYLYYVWANMRYFILTRQNKAAVENNIELFADMQDNAAKFSEKSKKKEYQRICGLSEDELKTEAATRAEISLQRHKGNHIPFLKEQAAALVFYQMLDDPVERQKILRGLNMS
jgi:hypothetical protein